MGRVEADLGEDSVEEVEHRFDRSGRPGSGAGGVVPAWLSLSAFLGVRRRGVGGGVGLERSAEGAEQGEEGEGGEESERRRGRREEEGEVDSGGEEGEGGRSVGHGGREGVEEGGRGGEPAEEESDCIVGEGEEGEERGLGVG